MNDLAAYTPPNVWTWDKENGGQFAGNQPCIFGKVAVHRAARGTVVNDSKMRSGGIPNSRSIAVAISPSRASF